MWNMKNTQVKKIKKVLCIFGCVKFGNFSKHTRQDLKLNVGVNFDDKTAHIPREIWWWINQKIEFRINVN